LDFASQKIRRNGSLTESDFRTIREGQIVKCISNEDVELKNKLTIGKKYRVIRRFDHMKMLEIYDDNGGLILASFGLFSY